MHELPGQQGSRYMHAAGPIHPTAAPFFRECGVFVGWIGQFALWFGDVRGIQRIGNPSSARARAAGRSQLEGGSGRITQPIAHVEVES